MDTKEKAFWAMHEARQDEEVTMELCAAYQTRLETHHRRPLHARPLGDTVDWLLCVSREAKGCSTDNPGIRLRGADCRNGSWQAVVALTRWSVLIAHRDGFWHESNPDAAALRYLGAE